MGMKEGGFLKIFNTNYLTVNKEKTITANKTQPVTSVANNFST